MNAHKDVGADGEQLALEYLSTRGLRLIARNYRCAGGELDLIMLDGDTLALIEVRLRSSFTFGGAAASVTRTKQRRIAIAAKHLLISRKELARHRARFDVVALNDDTHGEINVDWIRDAFRL